MDITTIGGIILGITLIIAAIMAEGSILSFWSVSSILIVFGGVLAATLINYPLAQVISVMKVVKVAFKGDGLKTIETIKEMIGMAEKARREGLLALDSESEFIEDDFLRKGIQLVIDGTDPELVRNILETEISMMEERHKVGYGVFESMGASAPAFGMLGTLIGLILMLQKLDDPSALGPGMAVALITTFYGSVIANLICLPIAGKLRLRSEEEILNREIIIEGILSIQAGENPRLVAEKMKAFLHPDDKDKLDRDSEKEEEG